MCLQPLPPINTFIYTTRQKKSKTPLNQKLQNLSLSQARRRRRRRRRSESMEKDNDSNVCTASFSPSFSTYSVDRLVEIADRVCYRDKSNEEFEFSMPAATSSSSSDVVFPVFNLNLISAVKSDDVSPEEETVIITPLKDLFLRERIDQPPPPQQTYSSSSDEEEEEDDEFDSIPSEIYCPWTPARSTAEMSPSGGCRKSKSTGSSSTSSWSTKRWRLRDLLKRSKSDGKQSLKFLNSNSINGDDGSSKTMMVMKKKEKVSSVSAHEKFYLRNKAIKEEDKRKSYLPYKQDLVGIFSNIHRYGKTFPPF